MEGRELVHRGLRRRRWRRLALGRGGRQVRLRLRRAGVWHGEVRELQAARGAVHAADAGLRQAHVPGALVPVHGRRLLRLVLPAVGGVLAGAVQLQLALERLQLRLAPAVEDHLVAAGPLREIGQEVPERRQHLVSAEAHDGLRLGLGGVLGHLLLVEDGLLDVVRLGQRLVGVREALDHVVEHRPELRARLALAGEGAAPLGRLRRVEPPLLLLHRAVCGEGAAHVLGVGDEHGVWRLQAGLLGHRHPLARCPVECAPGHL
mmetsp:Transcript_31181/g.92814  ORF Transcript_31181/g.92814 Transcript_31181/m.92814 type:complete len:262 (+) Transcript_31181:745-1530(+)